MRKPLKNQKKHCVEQTNQLLNKLLKIREIRTICHCGKKATMVIRQDSNGKVIKSGAQIEIGGNEKYISLCRLHWKQMLG